MLALYYPYVYFGNIEWLLSSLLYWDGIGRLVPSGESLDDPDYIKRLVDADIVFNVTPSQEEVDLVSAPYIERLARGHLVIPKPPELAEAFDDVNTYLLALLEGNLDAFSRIVVGNKRSKVISLPQLRMRARQELARQVFFVDPSIISPALREGMLGDGLAIERDQMIGLSAAFAREYVADLAGLVATTDRLVPVSPTPFYHFPPRRTEGSVPDDVSREAAGEVFAHYAFRTIGLDFGDQLQRWSSNSVQAWKEVDDCTDEVVKLRERLTPFRGSFQTAIRSVAGELPNVLTSPRTDILHRQLGQLYEARVAPALAALRRALEDTRFTTTEGLLDIKVALPALLSSTAGVIGLQLDQPALFGVAATTAAGALYRASRHRITRRDALLAESSVALLHMLDRELHPSMLYRLMGIQRIAL